MRKQSTSTHLIAMYSSGISIVWLFFLGLPHLEIRSSEIRELNQAF